MNRTRLFLPFAFLLLTCLSFSQTLAPGGPGSDAQWATAGKQGIGTSATLDSKVWFTLAQGVMTEVYYPDVTTANVHLLQLIVVNTKTKQIETEFDDMKSVDDETGRFLTFEQTSKPKSGEYQINRRYTTDPERNTLLIGVDIAFLTARSLREAGNYEFYVYYDSSLSNSGMHDTAWTEGGALLAKDGDIATALIAKKMEVVTPGLPILSQNGFTATTNGFFRVNDGLTQLRLSKKLTNQYSRAENGNVVQVGKLELPKTLYKNHANLELALGFGRTPEIALETARQSLKKGFWNCEVEYRDGWENYIRTVPEVDPKYQAQFNMAAMQLKANEDKTHPGANVASLTVPWGGGANANENNVGGYHLVWSRDLYQVATAYMALGDKAAANRALDFVFNVQQKPDGSFPQNSFLDGKPFWGSLQLDEVAFPLILAYQLDRTDRVTYEGHVRKAADFIVKNGPATPQERWEERPGYSPSTIAAEIAGLVCAADIAKKNGDTNIGKQISRHGRRLAGEY